MANINGSEFDDLIVGTDEHDLLNGGGGNDTIQGEAGYDEIHGGSGDDTIYGGDGGDTIYGDDGNDEIFGGGGTDLIYGGAGDDLIHAGADNDTIFGGDGSDTIILDDVGGSSTGTLNLTIDGGFGGNDNDTLDLSPLLAQGFEITNFVENPEFNGAEGGNYQITLVNPDTFQSININANDIENLVPCFTPGTMIATPRGEVPVETLKAGDMVVTRDNGLQEVCWTGQKALNWQEMTLAPELRPVLVRAGALGRGLPLRDMIVSPNHRLLITGDRPMLYFDETEVFAAAKHMVDGKGIVRLDTAPVTYVHFMCERHEVVLSDGAWTESFQPGDQALKGAGAAAQREIFALFPELKQHENREAYVAARRTLKRYEATVLAQ